MGARQGTDLLVIGAGVIGMSAAVEAAARGLSVTVIDREGPAAGASAGNAGGFAFPEIDPMASPGKLLAAPRWLFDPLGPLSIPPRHAVHVLPWMLRFARECLPARVRAARRAQGALMLHARRTLEPFMQRAGTLHMLRKRGQIRVYESVRAFEAARRSYESAESEGWRFQWLTSPDEIAGIQPGLSPRFQRGIFTQDWWAISDPRDYVLALAEALRAAGGRIVRAEARAVLPADDSVAVQTTDGEMRASHVVIAAGIHATRLTRSIGQDFPLEAERGYNTTLPPGAFDLRCHVTFDEHGFVAAPLSGGIRIGGAVELGGTELPPNFARARAMLRKAQDFMPGLRAEGGTEWMGMRPSLPDTLPVIGRAHRSPRVLFAFGHGHLGLTQSSATADIVIDLVQGRAPAVDIAPFSPDRFG